MFLLFSPTLTFLSSGFTFLNRHFYILVFLWCNLKATEAFFYIYIYISYTHLQPRDNQEIGEHVMEWLGFVVFFFLFSGICTTIAWCVQLVVCGLQWAEFVSRFMLKAAETGGLVTQIVCWSHFVWWKVTSILKKLLDWRRWYWYNHPNDLYWHRCHL